MENRNYVKPELWSPANTMMFPKWGTVRKPSSDTGKNPPRSKQHTHDTEPRSVSANRARDRPPSNFNTHDEYVEDFNRRNREALLTQTSVTAHALTDPGDENRAPNHQLTPKGHQLITAEIHPARSSPPPGGPLRHRPTPPPTRHNPLGPHRSRTRST